jgi:hypothetical protein
VRAIKKSGLLIAFVSASLISACSDPVPPPHAMLPGQSNVITKLLPEPSAQRPLPATPPEVVKAIGPEGFRDNFDRAELGDDWFNSGGPYRIQNGQLTHSLAHNHPLWLNRALPREVKIEFDCTGLSADGDVKVELFGDGRAAENDEDVARDAQYTATGYVFIFGGWKNRLSTIVKQAEHSWERDKSVPRRNDVRVEPGRSYHWTITRTMTPKGGHLDWQLDGKPFMEWDDPAPLEGPGHDRFAFEGWEAPAACGRLVITPVKKS